MTDSSRVPPLDLEAPAIIAKMTEAIEERLADNGYVIRMDSRAPDLASAAFVAAVDPLLGALRDARQRVTHLEEFRSRDAVVEQSLRAALAAAVEREKGYRDLEDAARAFVAMAYRVKKLDRDVVMDYVREIKGALSPTPPEAP